MGTTTETRITSTQAKDAIYKAHSIGSVTPEQFGVTFDDISIQAALDSMVNGGILLLKAGAIYTIKNTIVIPYSNITIIAYGSIINLGNYEINMVITKGYLDKVTRLSNIKLLGGTFDGLNYSGTNLANMRIIFYMVDNLTIRDNTLLSISGKYMITLADTLNTLIEDIYCNCNSDGIHLMGKNYNTVIKNIKGIAGDDLVAVTTLDYLTYAFTEGEVVGLHIENVYGTNITRIILLGCMKYKIDNVTMKNIYQLGTGACVNIGDGGELVEAPKIGSVVIENAYSSGDGILLRHKDMDKISISNTNCRIYIAREGSGFVGLNYLSVTNCTNTVIAESYTTKMAKVILKNINTSKIVLAGIIDNAILEQITLNTDSKALRLYGMINKLIIRDSKIAITASADQNINVYNQIETMILDNTYLENGGTSGNLINFNSSTSIIKNIIFNNTEAYNFRNIISSSYTGSESITIKFNNSYFSNFKRICEEGVSSSIYNIYFDNYTVSNALNEQIRLFNSQTINLYGNNVNLNVSLLSSDCSSNINCFISDASLDISKIKRTSKAKAYNSNNSLSCGIGYVVCNGTTWTNIATGLTY